MPNRAGIVLAGIACVAAVVSACTDGGGSVTPTTTPSATTSTSPSRTPTPTRTGPLTTGPNTRPGETPPDFPANAKAQNVEGALDFAFYFFKALDWSIATNDAALLRGLTASTCAACVKTINNLDDLANRHRKILGGRIRINGGSVVKGHFTIASDVVLRIRASQAEERLVDAAQKVIHESPASTQVSLVFVSWDRHRWSVVGLGGES